MSILAENFTVSGDWQDIATVEVRHSDCFCVYIDLEVNDSKRLYFEALGGLEPSGHPSYIIPIDTKPKYYHLQINQNAYRLKFDQDQRILLSWHIHKVTPYITLRCRAATPGNVPANLKAIALRSGN